MAYRLEVGDRMLTTKSFQDKNTFITVDELLNSTLVSFIQLAGNDWGYSGSVKELICN